MKKKGLNERPLFNIVLSPLDSNNHLKLCLLQTTANQRFLCC